MINSITSTSYATNTANTESSNTLGQSDFLKLLTTELQNQDPDAPMDSAAMLDQFATLSNVQAISSLESTMVDFAASQDSKTAFDAASMVGKEVSYTSNTFENVEGSLKAAIEPPIGAQEVTVQLKNSLGEILDELVINTSGDDVTYDFEFSGVESGNYTVSATYMDGDVEQATDIVQSSIVSKLRMEAGELLFKLDTGKFAQLSDIRTIS